MLILGGWVFLMSDVPLYTAVFLSIKVHQLTCQDYNTNGRSPLEPFPPEAGASRTRSSQSKGRGRAVFWSWGGRV